LAKGYGLIEGPVWDPEHGLYYAFPFLAGTRPSDAFQALAHLQQALAAASARVYRLTPGTLGATADQVEALAL
jgi:hypothetical protein